MQKRSLRNGAKKAAARQRCPRLRGIVLIASIRSSASASPEGVERGGGFAFGRQRLLGHRHTGEEASALGEDVCWLAGRWIHLEIDQQKEVKWFETILDRALTAEYGVNDAHAGRFRACGHEARRNAGLRGFAGFQRNSALVRRLLPRLHRRPRLVWAALAELAGVAGHGNVAVLAARPEGAVVVAEARVVPPALASIWFAPHGLRTGSWTRLVRLGIRGCRAAVYVSLATARSLAKSRLLPLR